MWLQRRRIAVFGVSSGLILGIGMAFATDQTEPVIPVEKPLWAAISVSDPVFDADVQSLDSFSLRLGLVNDSARTIDPELRASQLIVNGKELGDDWTFTMGNGIRDQRYSALPAGDNLSMSIEFGREFEGVLARHFRNPGIYRVSWKGKAFHSPELVFRVMPRRDR